MDILLQAVANLKANPNFRKKNYNEQLADLNYVFIEATKRDPVLAAKSPAYKMGFHQELMRQGPTYENPEFEALAKDLIKRADSGDGTAFATILSNIERRANANSSIISNVLTKFVIAPLAKAAGAKNLYQPGYMEGADADKFQSYAMSKYPEVKKAAGAITLGATLAGTIADIGAFNAIAGGPLAAAAGKAVARSLATKTLTGVAGRFASQGLPGLVSAITSSTAEGLFGLAKENVMALLTNNESRYTKTFGEAAKWFGSYAALDVALGITTSAVLPVMGGFIKNAKLAKQAMKLATASDEEAKTIIRQITAGDLDPVQKAMMSTYYDDLTQQNTLVRRMGDHGFDNLNLRPEQKAVFEAASNNMVLTKNTDKSWRLHMKKPGSDELVTETYDSIVSARRAMSETAWKNFADMTDDFKADYLKNPTNVELLKIAATGEEINNVLSPQLAKTKVATAGEIPNKKLSAEVPEAFRSAITRAEANTYLGVYGPNSITKAIEIDLPLTQAQLKAVADGKDLFPKEAKQIFQVAGTDPNATVRGLVIINNPASQEAVEQAKVLAQKAIANGSKETLDNLVANTLLQNGFDGIVTPQGVTTFFPDKVKAIAMAKTITAIPSKTLDSVSSAAQVSRAVDVSIPLEKAGANREALVQLATQITGAKDKTGIATLARGIAEMRDATDMKIRVMVGDKVQVTGTRSGIVIRVPQQITNAKEQADLVSSIINKIEDLTPTTEAKGTFTATAALKSRITANPARYTGPFKDTKLQEKWLTELVAGEGGNLAKQTDGSYLLRYKGGESVHPSLRDAVHGVALRTVDEGSLKMDLARKGYKLSGDAEVGFKVSGKELSGVVEAKTLPELMERISYIPQRLDTRYAPKEVRIVNGALEMTYENGVAAGNRRQALQLLDKFEDTRYAEKLKRVYGRGGGEVYVTPSKEYRVEIPEAGIIKNFRSADEARDYVNGAWKQFDHMKATGQEKGLILTMHNGEYQVQDALSGELKNFKTKDQVIDFYREYPDPHGARSILEVLDPKLAELTESAALSANWEGKIPRATTIIPDNAADSFAEAYKHPKWRAFWDRMRGAKRTAQTFTQQFTKWMENLSSDVSDPSLMNKFRTVEGGRRVASTEYSRLADLMDRWVFRGADGKKYSPQTLKKLFYYSGAQTADQLATYTKEFGVLTGPEQESLNKLRRILGTSANEGLAKLFGISQQDFVQNYMGRIRKAYQAMKPSDLANVTDAKDFLQKVYGKDGLPQNLDTWFQHERVNDLISFAVEDNIQVVMDKYLRLGMKQKYLEAPFLELKNYTNSLVKQGKIGSSEFTHINRYLEKVIGVYHVPAEKMVEDFGTKFFTALGLKNAENIGRNMMRNIYSLNYLTNMGMRPWLAIRNTQQIWSTLAARFGNQNVAKAVALANDLDDAGYQFFKRIGLMKTTAPVAGEVAKKGSVLGDVMEFSLRTFKSSDEYTRVVAYNTAKVQMDDAIGRLQKGLFKNPDADFLTFSGLDRVDDNLAQKIQFMVKNGQADEATALYGMALASETMFDYGTALQPAAYDGVIGKLFGQYGVYSVGYRADVARGLQYGTAATKAAFVGRFLANGAALFGSVSLLGITADNFLPGLPAMFTGGPLLDMAHTMIKATDVSTYGGRQARAELPTMMLQLVPGSVQARFFKKAWDFYQEGDYYRMFLALTGTPTRSARASGISGLGNLLVEELSPLPETLYQNMRPSG